MRIKENYTAANWSVQMTVRATGFGALQMTIPGYSHWSPINYGCKYYSAINVVGWLGMWAQPSNRTEAGSGLSQKICKDMGLQSNSTGNTSEETAVNAMTDNTMELQSPHWSRHKQEWGQRKQNALECVYRDSSHWPLMFWVEDT
jgi:hypothetical protein